MGALLFREVAKSFERIESLSGRLQITQELAALFAKCTPQEIERLILLTQGVVAPPFEGIEIGMGERFVLRAIASASGYDEKQVDPLYKQKGDLGLVAQELLARKRQSSLVSSTLTLNRVFDGFRRIANSHGKGSQETKIKILVELLSSATAIEGRYIARMPVGRMRLGIGEPTIIDALAAAKPEVKEVKASLERAFNLCSDLGLVARTATESPEKIARFKVTVLKPVRPALAERLSSAKDIIDRIGACGADAKYDGLRLQVHKKGGKVELFSRRLEKITGMFPEIVEAAAGLPNDEMLFEGEALAYDPKKGRYLPFQQTIQRKRKHGVAEMAGKFPTRLCVFDVLLLDGEDVSTRKFSERRKLVERIFGGRARGKNGGWNGGNTIVPTVYSEVKSADELDAFFAKCTAAGFEGIIAKQLDMPYTAGKRKFAWIKLKKSYGNLADSIDTVVVGYYLGRGARAQFEFGGLLCAVYNEDTDTLQTLARVGSGFSEAEMGQLRETLDGLKLTGKPKNLEAEIPADFWVEPKLVVTLVADEITISPMHTCCKEKGKGFALRFPRLVAIRGDKSANDITTAGEIEAMFGMQNKR